jgi:hypothetical protein
MKVMRFEAVTVVVLLQVQGFGMLLSFFVGKYLLKSLFVTLRMKAL